MVKTSLSLDGPNTPQGLFFSEDNTYMVKTSLYWMVLSIPQGLFFYEDNNIECIRIVAIRRHMDPWGC